MAPRADEDALEATLAWLQSLRDSEGELGQLARGHEHEGDDERGSSPAHFNSQDFRTWTLEQLHEATALDLGGLDYGHEELALLAPLNNLRALKLSMPTFARSELDRNRAELEVLAGLESLTYLSLDGYGLDAADFELLLTMEQLVELDISHNPELGLELLPELANLPALSYLRIERALGITVVQYAKEPQFEALLELLEARPELGISGLDFLTPEDIAGTSFRGPHELTISLSLTGQSPSWRLVLTLRNRGSRIARLSSLPFYDTNTLVNRFEDGSCLRILDADNAWRRLEIYPFGGFDLGNIYTPRLVVLAPGESLEFEMPITHDSERGFLFVSDISDISDVNEISVTDSHDLYATPAAPGDSLTLRCEISQGSDLRAAHNEDPYVEISQRIHARDWSGLLLSPTVELELP